MRSPAQKYPPAWCAEMAKSPGVLAAAAQFSIYCPVASVTETKVRGSNLKTEIRIVTIGCDAGICELVEAAAKMPQYSLVEAFAVNDGSGAETLRQAMPRVSNETVDWEDFVSGAMADLVLVGTLDDATHTVREQGDRILRRLVQSSVPLVTVHPVCEMLLAYELDMIRRDTECVLFPYIPFLSHSQVQEAVKQLTAPVDESQHRAVEQFSWERFAPATDRADERSLWHLSRDVIVLRNLLGEVTSVTATGGATGNHQYDNLSVHFAGLADQTTFARWSIGPGEVGARLTVKGEPAWIPLSLSADGRTCQRTLLGDTSPVESRESTAEQFLREVAATVLHGASWTGVGWDDVCRSLEVTDAVKRSISRRRTIELYHEQVTEHDTFKSMMAAGGCGMLLWVMLLLMIGGVVEGLRLPIRDSAIWSLWPFALLLPLVVFLAMQLLQFLFDARDDPKTKPNRGV